MKNLLVEALRQAGQSGEPSAPDDDTTPEPAATVEPAPSESEREAADPALELVDDGQGDSVEPALSNSLITPQPAVPEMPEPSAAAETSGTPDPSELRQGAVSADSAPIADDDTLTPSVAQIAARPDLLARAGRLSPLLYALTVTAAAASLTSYQRLNTDDMNVELGVLRERSAASGIAVAQREGWQALAAERTVDRSPLPHGGAKAAAAVEPRLEPAPADRWASSTVTPPLEDLAHEEVRRAYDAYQRGDYAEAEARYRDALTKDAYHLHALLGLAAVHERNERHNDAQALYRRVLSAHPTNADAASRLIAAFTRSGHDAETRLKLLAHQYAATPTIHTALGSLLAEQERWPEAYEAFTLALELQPEDADARYNLAVSAEQVGKFDAARDHYAAALSAASRTSAFDRQDVESRLAALKQFQGGQP